MAVPYIFAPNTKILAALVNANFAYLEAEIAATNVVVAALTTTVAGKLTATNNLSDLTNVVTARGNLGLGSAALAPLGTSGATLGLLNANKTDSGNNIFSGANTVSGSLAVPTQAAGNSSTLSASTAFVAAALTAALGGAVTRSYLAGLTLSTAGSSATFGISAGVAANTTNVSMMTLPTAYTKTTAVWAVGSGNGALDVPANVINNSWYHTYLIQRPDTGVVDVLVSQAPGTAGTATITIASPGVVTEANHGLQISAPVVFTTTGALPTGLTAGVVYFVLTVPTVNSFTVAATQGGAAIATTGSQSGVHTATSNPVLPANYTLYRRIGSMLTNGSAQWVAFVQVGDFFQWMVPTLDVNTAALSTTAVLSQINTPSGVNTTAYMVGYITGASNLAVLVSSPLTTDTLPVIGGLGMSAFGGGGDPTPISVQIVTDPSRQIRLRASTASTTVMLTTQGWTDVRGKAA